jgi:hypothetical protein
VLCLANNTCVHETFGHLRDRFVKLYRSRAYRHHFTGEGMDESHFDVCLESLTGLMGEYMALQTPRSPPPRFSVP